MDIVKLVAKDMLAALKQVRQLLGEDALILESREVEGGVEVSASAPEDSARPQQHSTAKLSEQHYAKIHDIKTFLQNQGVSPHGVEKVEAFLKETMLQNGADLPVAEYIRFIFEQMFNTNTQNIFENHRCVVLSGPTGAGKSVTIAKLGLLSLMQLKQTPLLITMDSGKAGAVTQLTTYAGHLNVPFVPTDSLNAIKALMAEHEGPVLIDTPGLTSFKSIDFEPRTKLLQELNAKGVFVAPAGTDMYELKHMMHNAAQAGFDTSIITKIDTISRLGYLFELLASGMQVSYFANSPSIGQPLLNSAQDIIKSFEMG